MYKIQCKPDFIYKAAAPDKRGCTYRIHFTDTDSDDPVIYIYGETSDSPKLDRIDREHFFYRTVYERDFVTPVVLTADGKTIDIKDYENNGWVFTSSYEDGVTTLKGITISSNAYSPARVEITLKKLDGLVWRDIDIPLFNTAFKGSSDTATIAKELEQGVYRIEATINGKTTSTEFYVY